MNNRIYTGTEVQKEFIKEFNTLCYSKNRWNVWSDFVLMSAISISNAVDVNNREDRENTYKNLISSYSEKEQKVIANLFGLLVEGYEQSIDQDFLGELYMALELSNKNNGQFFTPYCVCKAIAKMNFCGLKEQIDKKGWVSVSDPACGAGALLVAFASECKEKEINYQTTVLFVAQDIDYVTGCMCYIQLSLLGCPGYVVIADTISNPAVSIDGRGLIPLQKDNQIFWFTPFYFREEWHYRRIFSQLDMMLSANSDDHPCKENEGKHTDDQIIPDLIVKKSGQISLF